MVPCVAWRLGMTAWHDSLAERVHNPWSHRSTCGLIGAMSARTHCSTAVLCAIGSTCTMDTYKVRAVCHRHASHATLRGPSPGCACGASVSDLSYVCSTTVGCCWGHAWNVCGVQVLSLMTSSSLAARARFTDARRLLAMMPSDTFAFTCACHAPVLAGSPQQYCPSPWVRTGARACMPSARLQYPARPLLIPLLHCRQRSCLEVLGLCSEPASARQAHPGCSSNMYSRTLGDHPRPPMDEIAVFSETLTCP